MNPEFRRNLWLELSWHRLVLIAAVVCALGALCASAWQGERVLRTVALTAAVIVCVVWGARQAANSVLDEIRELTWDAQRMSSLSPWSMAWGKLCGATIVSWWAAAWCMAFFIASTAHEEWTRTALIIVLVVAAGIVGQCLALCAALAGSTRHGRAQARFSHVALLLLLLVVVPNVLKFSDDTAFVTWYGARYERLPFAAASFSLFAAWSVFGLARAMGQALQLRMLPWAWLACGVFSAAFLLGFAASPASPGAALSVLATIAIVQSYIAGFAIPNEALDYRRALHAWSTGQPGRAFGDAPLWLVSACLALAAALGAAIVGSDPSVSNQRVDNLGLVALALACMLLRDIALLFLLRMSDRVARAETTTIIYLLALDILLPSIFNSSGLVGIAEMIRPAYFDAPADATLIMALQAAFVVILAHAAYRRAFTTVK